MAFDPFLRVLGITMQRPKAGLILILFILFVHSPVFAGNLFLSTTSLPGKDTAAQQADIQFDVSWDNSWCDSGAACNGDVQSQLANWDAVWLFAKFSKRSTETASWSDWASCTLSADDRDHAAAAGSQIRTGRTPLSGGAGKGAFLYRNTSGVGSNVFSGIRLRWLYGTDGVKDADLVRIKIFGIEMVYIPQGDFFIGDGSVTPEANFRLADGTAGAIQIVSSLSKAVNASSAFNKYDDTYLKQGARAPGKGAGIRISGDGGIYYADGTLINVFFPTGYHAFYVMKYELSQGQYRDFLNTLPRSQQNARTASQIGGQYAMSNMPKVINRNGIRVPESVPADEITFGCDLEGITDDNATSGDGTFNEHNDGEGVPVNLLTWMDIAAFADWAGLRPLTELEFEKAARGPRQPVRDEYAWGSIHVTQVIGISDSGQNSEIPLNTGANCVYGSHPSVQGPIRIGGIAGNSECTRNCVGASYYGVMDLSGNLWERLVTVGNSAGRAFDGSHGDGELSASGNANTPSWPGINDGEVTGATGSGFRGGSWIYGVLQARVSDRYYAAYGVASRCHNKGTCGARLVRTDPQVK